MISSKNCYIKTEPFPRPKFLLAEFYLHFTLQGQMQPMKR